MASVSCVGQHATVREYVKSVTVDLPRAAQVTNPMPQICTGPVVTWQDVDEKTVRGTSTLRFIIGGDGRVYEPRVEDSDLPGVVNVAFLRALSLWQFKPHVKDGRLHHVPAVVTASFSADENRLETDMCGQHVLWRKGGRLDRVPGSG